MRLDQWLEWRRRCVLKRIGELMAQNQGKPANSTNGTSFAELMQQLRGES